MWWELSARIGGLGFLFDLADHLVQVGEDLLIHCGDSCVSLACGHLDEGEGPAALLA
jgi:predicted ATP-grasp superfamily ATP-dependent carboligase